MEVAQLTKIPMTARLLICRRQLVLCLHQISYNGRMKSKVLSRTNPHLRDAARALRRRIRSVASSTAIETGESVRAIEEKLNQEKINRSHSAWTRVTLA